MKITLKHLIASALLFAVGLLIASDPSETSYMDLPLAVTKIAANSTNTAAGTARLLNTGPLYTTIFATGAGNVQATNGTVTLKFSIASGTGTTTNSFTDAATSLIKIVIPSGGLTSTTNTFSDVFSVPGVRYIRCGQIENACNGAVSNLSVRIGLIR